MDSKKLTLEIPPELHKRLKAKAVQEEKSLREIAISAFLATLETAA